MLANAMLTVFVCLDFLIGSVMEGGLTVTSGRVRPEVGKSVTHRDDGAVSSTRHMHFHHAHRVYRRALDAVVATDILEHLI
jgi:hypothetical protein